MQANGHLVEVFVSNEGTSWTIVVTRPAWSCIVAVGEHWESLPHPVTSPPPSTAAPQRRTVREGTALAALGTCARRHYMYHRFYKNGLINLLVTLVVAKWRGGQ